MCVPFVGADAFKRANVGKSGIRRDALHMMSVCTGRFLAPGSRRPWTPRWPACHADQGDGLGKISQARLIRGRFFTINAIPAEAA